MSRVVIVAEGLIDPGSAPCFVVWADPIGRPQYGSFESYANSAKPPSSVAVGDVDWQVTIDAARTHADRSGIEFVYVVR